MSKKNKENSDVIYIGENAETIEIFDDFWNIHQILRSNYYLLSSLEETLKNFSSIEPIKKKSKNKYIYYIEGSIEKANLFLTNIKKLKNIYENDEKKLLENSANFNINFTKFHEETESQKESAATTNCKPLSYQYVFKNLPKEPCTPLLNINDLESFFDRLKNYIDLSSKMEKLANEILDFLYISRTYVNEVLSQKYLEMKSEFLLRKQFDSFKKILDYNTNKDKIINYEIVLNQNNNSKKDALKYFKRLQQKYGDKSLNNRIFIKKQDYRYANDVLINCVLSEYKKTNEINRNNFENSRNYQLKVLNRILLYIGIISFIISIINTHDTIISIMSYLSIQELLLIFIGIIITIIGAFILIEATIFKES